MVYSHHTATETQRGLSFFNLYLYENWGAVKIPFYENAIQCLTKDRLNPEFFLLRPIKEKKIIVYDDILTTGSTLLATYELLKDREQLLFLVGINNN